MKRHDSIVIKKMITYCDQIDEMMDRFGAEETMFNTDYAYQYAVGMCIIQIGELVTRLTSNIVLFQCPLNRVQRRLCSEATYTHQIRSQHRMKSSWAAKDLPSP